MTHIRRLWQLLLVVSLTLLALSGTRLLAQEYRISPEDVLTITIVDHPELGGNVTVATDGSIQLPVIGQIPVAGMTTIELTKKLEVGFKKRLVAPEVYVILAARNPQVYVVGLAGKAGVFPLTQNRRLLTLLASAGGMAKPEEYRARLLRKATGQQVPVDLVRVMAGDPAANLELQEGDVLIVESLLSLTVYVTGEVEAPGMYEIPEGGTVSQALALSRGVRGKLEDKRATILRNTQTLPVDLAAVYAPGGAGDVALQDGDVLRVESALISVIVSGEVKTPATYPVASGLGVAEVLNLAGGATPAALLSGITVTHLDGAQDIINLPQAQQQGAKFPLRDGDRLFVPTALVQVGVSGEVKSPGTYPVTPVMRVADLLTLAGGPTAAASLGAVKVLRAGGAIETVDAATATVTLRDGDRLLVPALFVGVTVLGEVKQPGAFQMAPTMTVADAIALAGGATPAAALSGVKVAHAGGIVETVDANTAQLQVKEGDRITVPSALVTLSVSGEVKTPGTFQVAPGLGVAELLALAGGATPAAALTDLRVIHLGGSGAPIALQAKGAWADGDRLVVPSQLINVTVSGEVKTPGAYQVAPTAKLADLLALAGGATPAAALTTVQVVHLGGPVEIVDSAATRAILRDGDRVLVPSSLISIALAGEVKVPGMYQVAPTLTVAQALAAAGGPTPSAALKAVQVLHVGGTVETVDGATSKLVVRDGDRLTVPMLFLAVVVAGEVKTPGAYQLAPTMTVADAVAMAGGLTGAAAADQIQVTHLGGTAETVSATAKLRLQDGDRVTVPSALVSVEVSGEVKTRGIYKVLPQTSLADLLAMAGGTTPAAARTAVQVARFGGAMQTVDAATAQLTFAEGDRVLVPTSLIGVSISGEVKTPGAYQCAPKTTIGNALSLAGGPTGAAALGAVKIMHLDGGIETVDAAVSTQTLRDGDRVLVPLWLVSVTIGGEVKTPGVYQVAPTMTATEAVALAGGVLPTANRASVQVAHVGGTIEVVDLATARLTLKDGDRVMVPTASITVAVTGEVKTPGTYQMGALLTVADAIAVAGGATPSAAMQQVKIVHLNGAIETVDATAAKTPLKDGDRVLVPTWLISVAVVGEVKTPGTYQLSPTMTAADAISMAGGATIAAAIDKVQVTHLGGAVEVIDVASAKQPLKDGDRLLLPTALVSVTVAGEVKSPGTYQLSPQMTVADALALAGGPLPTAAIARVQLMHVGGALEAVNVATTKVTLREGDRITVPTALVSVTVSGEVLKPGSYQVSTVMSAADAIAIAGGPTKTAALSRVQILHATGTVETIDTGVTPQGTAILTLREGDRVVVPTSTDRISVCGSVRNPGLYPIDTQRPYTVSEAILLAQGISDTDAPKRIKVTRTVDGKPLVLTYSVDAVMSHRDPTANITLAPGDVVNVEKRDKKATWREVIQYALQGLSAYALIQSVK